MLFVFWGLTFSMLIVAVGTVMVALRSQRAIHGRSGMAVLVLVPAIAAGLYAKLGSPDAATAEFGQQYRGQSVAGSSPENRTGKTIGSVSSLVMGLKRRLENKTDDGGGWLLLAKSYTHLGRIEDASAAYERARSLGKNDAEFEQSPGNASAAEEVSPDDIGPALRGKVTLSADATALVEPGDTIFVFARESADQRMPVVALRKPATELPFQFVLTDRDALVSGTSLSNFDQLTVSAMVSRSGLASEVVQDLEVWSDPVSPAGGQAVELLITARSEVTADTVGDRNE